MSYERKITSFLKEPDNELYQQLLKYGSQKCSEAMLIVRAGLPLDDSGKEFLNYVSPFLKKVTESQEWPGTYLLDGHAQVYHYRPTPEFIQILLHTTNALYSWSQPALPEDLCLIRSDQAPWLVSISHEKDGYLYLSGTELHQLLSTYPSIATLVQVNK